MANVTIRMEDKLKKEAEELFNNLGMTITTAFTIFAKQAIREQRIPFEITLNVPNAETRAALGESKAIMSGRVKSKQYHTAKELFEELDEELDEEMEGE